MACYECTFTSTFTINKTVVYLFADELLFFNSLIIMRDPKGITWNTLFRKNNTKNIIMFFDQKIEDILFTKVI